MKKALQILFLIVISSYANANKELTGYIKSFDCGDNCYLTIVDKNNSEHSGLCTADICEKFYDYPNAFIGMKVWIKVGKDAQVDGDGNLMGITDSYKKIFIVEK